MMGKSNNFEPTKKRKDIPTLLCIKSRIVGPIALAKAIKNPINYDRCIGNILFTARYISGKAIEGYDFV